MAEKKVRVRFLQSCEVRDHNGAVVESFGVGKEYAMSEPSARHWITRQAAEIADPPAQSARTTQQESSARAAKNPKNASGDAAGAKPQSGGAVGGGQ